MLRRTMAAVMAITLIAFAGGAIAQTACVMGLYMDTAGTIGSHDPHQLQVFQFHIVMHVESTVAGAAYTLSFPGHVQNLGAYAYGPSGLGLNVPGSGGNNVGLGECAIGFNMQPVLVASYSAFTQYGPQGPSSIDLGPNTDEDPAYPVYADCADNLWVCDGVSSLALGPVSNDSRSMGAVKSLYGN